MAKQQSQDHAAVRAKPTFAEAGAAVLDELNEEEMSELDEGVKDRQTVRDQMPTSATSDQFPEWAVVPKGLKMPKGAQVCCMRFRPGMTGRHDKGERQCILWNLSCNDEKIAIKRTRGDAMRTLSEMAKIMIRAIDGVPADWSGTPGAPGSVEAFWEEIGPGCRGAIQSYYAKTHVFSAEEQIDFFANCIAVATVSG